MNIRAHALGMKTTVFTNPHGLADKGNKSCSADVATMAIEYLKSERLRAYSRTTLHTAHIEYSTGERIATWMNTNFLL